MKKIVKLLTFLIIFSMIFSLFSLLIYAKDSDFVSISAKSVCLIDATSGRVLYGKNEGIRLPMASTTKIMTAIIALESEIPLSTVINAPKEAIGIEGSSIYLYEGERITLKALLYALLLCSANDAAVAIAITVSGTVERFVEKMNAKALELGLKDTHFTNPHGLYDEDHYTTAKDLAILMAHCMENEAFSAISGCEKKVFPRNDGSTRVMINHNRLLKENKFVIAGKTGYTKKSGRCLVTCAKNEGLSLVCVTLNAPDDWNDHTKLYEFGFSNYKRVVLSPVSVDIPVISGQKATVMARSNEISLLLPSSYEGIDVTIEAPRFIFSGLKCGEAIGRIVYRYRGKVIASSPLLLCEDALRIKYKFDLLEWLINLFKK